MRDRQNKYNTNLEVIRNQKMQPNNTSGVKGVDYHKGRDEWRARVHVGGKEITKWFKNKEDAVKWRKEAEEEYYKPKIDNAVKAGDLKEDIELSNEYDSLDDIEEKYKDYTKYLILHDNEDKISISNIVVNEKDRGKGIGQKILSDIMAYADNHNKIITLTPTKEFGTYERLKKWYKKNGFIE